jgi:hypothetical protein
MNYVQFILGIVAHFEWEVCYMDAKSDFLHGDLIEDIYIEKPLGFEKNSNVMCPLKKSLNGLKHVPKVWYETIDMFFLNFGFNHC